MKSRGSYCCSTQLSRSMTGSMQESIRKNTNEGTGTGYL